MTDLSKFSLAKLSDDGELALSRAVGDGLLLLPPASPQPTPATLSRLEHAFSLGDALDPSWATSPALTGRVCG